MSRFEELNDDREEVIELSFSPHEVWAILDLPPRRAAAATVITELLRQRNYHAHFITGDDKPEGVAFPLGVWPHPTAEDLAAISEAAEMPVRTPEQRAELESQSSLTSVA